MDFVENGEENDMENKIFAYMRISTNKATQKTDRQQQTIWMIATTKNYIR